MTSPKWPLVFGLIMEEYIKTGKPVGSAYLVENYDLNVSSATVRNIMADLTAEGYLTQPHTSAGRIPTAKAFRYYVQYHLRPESSHQDHLRDLQSIPNDLTNVYELLAFIAQTIASSTRSLGVAMIDDKVAVHGYGQLLNYPEISVPGRIEQVIQLMEDQRNLNQLFSILRSHGIRFIIGDEIPLSGAQDLTVLLAQCQIGPFRTYMGAVGPLRIDYERVLTTLSYLSCNTY